MATKFLSLEAQYNAGVNRSDSGGIAGGELTPAAEVPPLAPERQTSSAPFSTIQNQEDAPPCSICGSIMIRSGACYKCVNCGNTSGCA
jgi:ribonucleoside-diphosphate reductase alpha chain